MNYHSYFVQGRPSQERCHGNRPLQCLRQETSPETCQFIFSFLLHVVLTHVRAGGANDVCYGCRPTCQRLVLLDWNLFPQG